MQVKIISTSKASLLETSVNDYISKMPEGEIVIDIKYAIEAVNYYVSTHSAMIIFEKK